MPKDQLQGIQSEYDVIVIGSGLAGLTCANILGRMGRRVLVLEHHYQLGGMATWFRRKRGHIFDISLHGFPFGMVKSCKRYWNDDIASRIEPIRGIRFDNPQFSFETTYDRKDFTRILVERFQQPLERVEAFFDKARSFNFYDDDGTTTGQFLERCFPGRNDVHRLLMEPIAYANGSTLDDPALTFGIVFSNFMSKGVYIFKGGTDLMVGLMKKELIRNGVDVRIYSDVERVLVESGRVTGVVCNGRPIRARSVVSNANLRGTIQRLVGEEHFASDFLEKARKVRLSSSSCQVYMGLKPGESFDYLGDLFFTSTLDHFDSVALCAKDVTSRTFSCYYPDTRPGSDRYSIVSSTNANWDDWASLPPEEYEREKAKLIEDTICALERYLPDIRGKLDWIEAATPGTFSRYTKTVHGATFGTKFEGLSVSKAIPEQIAGLWHAGSVGIIMSGWLGTINYGVIVSNEVDSYLSRSNAVRATEEV
ncbi:MAG: NAD(P)/FAD-dependent oxidoreductase [Candidatus Wallbacteria bacterium]|nr:NAD(P)/FAD-dependent oxidoreductase [Candidatus Wallbacteria bacterium]